jgi:hypothetical protein
MQETSHSYDPLKMTLKILCFADEGSYMNTLGKYCNSKTYQDIYLSDIHVVSCNPINEVIIQLDDNST